MKKLATKLTPAIKAWIKEEFGSDYYSTYNEKYLFHFPNIFNNKGYIQNQHLWMILENDYTEVSEQEFLAEFGKPKIWNGSELQIRDVGSVNWRELRNNIEYRIKPTPDYSKEIEALEEKAKENGMKVTIKFEKL